MVKRRKRTGLGELAAGQTGDARPHPGPLPRGEGELLAAAVQFGSAGLAEGLRVETKRADLDPTLEIGCVSDARDRDEAVLANDFTVWQIMDSAFPTGGFAHSVGLEAAWQHGEVRNREELASYLETSLQQLGHASLPFVIAAFEEPERLREFDQWCEAFTTNHVANRASRSQGRAFLTAVERIFGVGQSWRVASTEGAKSKTGATSALRAGHLAPVFGASLRRLGMARATTARMFCFNHLRSLLAAAVRLNIIGPMEAQTLQHRLAPKIEVLLKHCDTLTLEDLAQTAPLLDLWQGAQDRLYSRLFQS